MNIFVTDPNPLKSARVLPDKHIVKMPLETCQMLAIVCSDKWGHGFGTLPKADGTPYATEKGAFRNHPCTIWANSFVNNWRWLLAHGFALCNEYALRYGKPHTCFNTLQAANEILPCADPQGRSGKGPTPFVFAGPDEFKLDTSISVFDKYKMYIASKPWVCDNYLRIPDRKPDWI
ncbi:hypothetical protein CMO86_09620 [Candidatus Woesearchaeota archaeon]|jgi:hypothetical protein|nr:hypothetical protein [Candidatus Woesearchaeota archaeon]